MLTLPVSYSVTCADALLRNVIPLFQVEQAVKCEFWCQGLNDSYKVSTANKTFLLRIYRYQWRSLEEIQFEIDVLLHLKVNGADIAYPIATEKGDYIVTLATPEGRRHAILTTYIEGHELDLSCPESAPLYGQHMAQLHQRSTHFRSNNNRFKLDVSHLITQPISRIKPFLAHRQCDWVFITGYAQTLALALQDALNNSRDIGLCHADLSGGNAHYDGNKITSFDFDCCAIGLRVYDLAVFKWSLIHNENKKILWEKFLKSYLLHRPLSTADLQLIDILVSIRHIWLMGLHIDIAVAKGWLSEEYFSQAISFLRTQQQE